MCAASQVFSGAELPLVDGFRGPEGADHLAASGSGVQELPHPAGNRPLEERCLERQQELSLFLIALWLFGVSDVLDFVKLFS